MTPTRPSSPRLDVAVVGSVNLDLVVTARRIPAPGETVLGTAYEEHPGGKGLNQAVACAMAGARTALRAAVGDDDAGARLRRVMTDAGIDATAVDIVAATPTGRAIITVDEAAENSIVVVPGANHHLVDVDPVPDATVVLAQLEIPHETVLRAFTAARSRGATTVLNPSPAAELDAELLVQCDIVVPNEHEVELLGGVAGLLDAGVGVVVVTRGAAGADVHTIEGSSHQPAFAVTPVDTTGAGDAFCGSLVARLALGDDIAEAARWASAAGALATTRHGAVPSIPTAAEVEALLGT